MSIESRCINKTEIICMLEEYTRISYEIIKIKQYIYDLKNNYLLQITKESDNSIKKKIFDQYIIDLEIFGSESNISEYTQLKYKKKQLVTYFNKLNIKSNSKHNLLEYDTPKQKYSLQLDNNYQISKENTDYRKKQELKVTELPKVTEDDNLNDILNLLLSKYKNN